MPNFTIKPTVDSWVTGPSVTLNSELNTNTANWFPYGPTVPAYGASLHPNGSFETAQSNWTSNNYGSPTHFEPLGGQSGWVPNADGGLSGPKMGQQTVVYDSASANAFILADSQAYMTARPAGTTHVRFRARLRVSSASAGTPALSVRFYRFEENINIFPSQDLTLTSNTEEWQTLDWIQPVSAWQASNVKVWLYITPTAVVPAGGRYVIDIDELTAQPWTSGSYVMTPGSLSWVSAQAPGLLRPGGMELAYASDYDGPGVVYSIYPDAYPGGYQGFIGAGQVFLARTWVRNMTPNPVEVRLQARCDTAAGVYAGSVYLNAISTLRPVNGWQRIDGAIRYSDLVAAVPTAGKVNAEVYAFVGQGTAGRVQFGQIAGYITAEQGTVVSAIRPSGGLPGTIRTFALGPNPLTVTDGDAQLLREAVRGRPEVVETA